MRSCASIGASSSAADRTSRELTPRGSCLLALGGSLIALGLVGCAGNSSPPSTPPPTQEAVDGFTQLTPSRDTITIYVSSSSGSDSNDGLTSETAVRSVERGVGLLRDGSADWLLFKRGDTWKSGLGGWSISGRSSTERIVVGAYGSGPRPRFEFRGEALLVNGATTEREGLDNLVFVSLHLLGSEHDPSNGMPTGPSPVCVAWLRGGSDVLFEDMRFEFCQVNVMEVDGVATERFRFHRCLFLDSFSMSDAHAQALFLNNVKQMVLEENIFDRCGWHPDFGAADPTIFNHCIYWQYEGPADGVVSGNLILRASSHGALMRSSGRVEGNLFARNAIGGFLGASFNQAPAGTQGTLIGNLFTEGEDIQPRPGHQGDIPRGWGWDVEGEPSIRNAILRDNIFTHCRARNCRSLLRSHLDNRIEKNTVWKWSARDASYLLEAVGPFKDPNRSLASYNASLGGAESFEAFVAEVRQQSKTRWREEYMADRIIQYFRDGFATP